MAALARKWEPYGTEYGFETIVYVVVQKKAESEKELMQKIEAREVFGGGDLPGDDEGKIGVRCGEDPRQEAPDFIAIDLADGC